MAQFDTRGETQSLVSGSIPRPGIAGGIDLEEGMRRNVSEVAEMIRNLLTRQFTAVEQKYSDTEEYNSQKLSQETLYNLLRQFDIYPPITRGEIRDLWGTLLTNKDNTITWMQFISQFGFTGQTHTFTNSHKSPPKQGDKDYSLRSKKFNSDKEIQIESSRHTVEYRWEELRRCFVALDPHQTGCISDKEFEDVVSEICVHVTSHDLENIMQKHAASDHRVNYVSFLGEFGREKEVWRTGNDMFSLLTHPRTPFGISDVVENPQNGLIGISASLRNKLSGNWKNLRRAFQKMDKKGSGYLPLPQFRGVLQLANIVLDEDEVYHVMSQLDQDLTGRLDYNKFLGELFRPISQRSSRCSSRGLLPLSRQSGKGSVLLESRAAGSRQSVA
ncbi:EF-hand calcium-binding domain-containing protein 6-like [Watersipora subatra]|uniref:EF-hand calcium-binding domain-containing protein 6-like n=1 Tax=Watersipora subatra TaxID=2589382 RepID=UPI00355BB67C